jgi:protein-disulfide isomerase
MPQIDKEYIQTGKIQYVLRDFPIESLHPLAFEGHAAAHCAGEQGKYWEMHSKLFANQKAMGPKDFSDHAHALRLDVAKFDRCLDSKKYSAKVRASIADGQKAGVQGTPTFFLGFPETDVTKIKAVQLIRGAQPYPLFKTAIDSLLGEQK